MYVNTGQWCANYMNEQFILEQKNDTYCKLEGNKNDEFWNVTRSYEWSFLRIGTKQEGIGNGKKQF